MNTDILELVKAKKEQLVNCRRDLHKHAETAWTEFRTAAIVAETLTRLGYQVAVGEEVIDAEVMMGVPSQQELINHQERAIAQGADPNWVGRMQGGKTGVMGVMHFVQPGPVVAFRFDMDANDVVEAMLEEHRPWREGFASVNSGAMHACGHDGHTSIGLTLAEVLAEMKNVFAGTVKLIFQPAEEGVRGAKAMVSRGIVDDVDFFVGLHVGIGLKQMGTMTCNTVGFLATTKLDAVYTGVPAHAGAAPETGQNALLAAATAALNLHAISRHSQGASRINVGVLQAGTGRNVIPDQAILKLETRGTTSEINDYMYQRAIRILEAAAAMHDVKLVLSPMGGAANCDNNPILVERLQQVAEKSNLFESILPEGDIGGSEDCTYFMERVQQKGGQAAYLMVGTELAAGHHDSRFDFDEDSLVRAAALLGNTAIELLSKK
ncbi:amidohydrolase [Sporomusa malonica]|uniref:Aminobenzoyl-glutamate utilization protein A n=1 Tax=Sporomusa malonica TaxID=112901 RepID=A0A1W2ERE0_9FIRM|nr:amidohydrolase [Sporomusa malonica]SMD12251.1 aminobenzoyl-glutamate utilization protein A [Sporomusa malonica]